MNQNERKASNTISLLAVSVAALLGGLGTLPLLRAAGAKGSDALASVSGTASASAVCMVASLGRICKRNAVFMGQ